MPLFPTRRWFQFSLSTWFVLVAILAWAMMCRPWYHETNWFWRDGKIIVINGRGVVTTPYVLNHNALYPALTLAAFVGWKAAWAASEYS